MWIMVELPDIDTSGCDRDLVNFTNYILVQWEWL